MIVKNEIKNQCRLSLAQLVVARETNVIMVMMHGLCPLVKETSLSMSQLVFVCKKSTTSVFEIFLRPNDFEI